MRDRSESNLAQSLHLSQSSLAEVEVFRSGALFMFSDLLVASLLQAGVEAEEENGPAESGGGGV